MTTRWTRNLLPAAACLAALVLAGCQKGDRIPPKGATITLAANPTTIPLGSSAICQTALQVTTCGTSQVVATVSNELGVPLPDQDVRFSTTAGALFFDLTNLVNASNLPIQTDSLGNAQVSLVTTTNSTVTARSGVTSGTLNLNTVTGNLSQILLDLDQDPNSPCGTNNDPIITSCSQEVCFVATAKDTSGNPVQGVTIVFKLQNNTTGSSTFNATFVTSQPTTPADGEVHTVMTPGSDCGTQCSGNKCSQADVVAQTSGGAFQSFPFRVTINIP